MSVMHNIKGYASYVPATAFLGAEAAGIPAHKIAFPGPMSALSAGLLSGSSLWHSGGLHFGGAWGYKTFFSGTGQGVMSSYSLGSSMLNITEAIGKNMWDKGVRNKFTAWASSATKLGFTGAATAKDFASYGEAMTYATRMSSNVSVADAISTGSIKGNKAYSALRYSRIKGIGELKVSEKAAAKTMLYKGANQGNKFTRFMGGQSTKVEESFVKQITREGKDDLFRVMLRHDASGYLFKGRAMAALGTFASAASWISIAAPLVRWSGEQVLNSAAGRIGELSDMMANTNFHMGRGYPPQTFNNQQAATERQRAVQAIYASKVNPSNRMYGNEAAHYHR